MDSEITVFREKSEDTGQVTPWLLARGDTGILGRENTGHI